MMMINDVDDDDMLCYDIDDCDEYDNVKQIQICHQTGSVFRFQS